MPSPWVAASLWFDCIYHKEQTLIFFSSGDILAVTIRDLKIQKRNGNENVQNIIGLMSKTITLHEHHTFLTFLCRFYTNTTWKGLISRFMENVNKCVGIIALKAERTQIHFLSDVLVAVASLDLKVPIFS